MIEKIGKFVDKFKDLGDVMVNMASNLMLADERVLWMAQREAMTCSRIITCLQKIAAYRLATAQAFFLVSICSPLPLHTFKVIKSMQTSADSKTDVLLNHLLQCISAFPFVCWMAWEPSIWTFHGPVGFIVFAMYFLSILLHLTSLPSYIVSLPILCLEDVLLPQMIHLGISRQAESGLDKCGYPQSRLFFKLPGLSCDPVNTKP
nr:adhesion G protein-coupled receptor A3-like [Labrus bergylta]